MLYRTSTSRTQTRRPARRAYSLVEMIAATALVAGTLAPALAVMRDAMAVSRETARRNLLALYAVQVLEYEAGASMQGWTVGTTTGSFSSDGHPAIRYVVTRSDASADGGLTNQLMHVQATVFDDANGSSALDAGEESVRFRTKVAKLLSYQDEPT